ncbi:hypothetical protein ABZS66_51090 [Dactylosporangium sp. NPDC005572]|uniref:hypothetical protein n=1 Tax=Dactylosporangium sp. NPDC005572 TaxID=3156889 RepID=UPI0033AA4EE5
MTGYILHIARNDAGPGEPDESVTVRVTAAFGGLRINEVTPGRDREHRMPPFDLHAVATALIGVPPVPVPDPPAGGGRPRRRPHRPARVVRHATSG